MNKILGDILKNARENRGLTLDEVALETKIQKRYLEDLEKEDFEDMPGKVYERGFLRTYAEALGLDAKEVLELHDEIRSDKKVEEVNEEEHHEEKQKKSKLKIFLGIIVIVFIGFGAVKILEIIDKKSNKVEAVAIAEEEKVQEPTEQKQETVASDIPESEIEVVDSSTTSALEIKISKRVEVKLTGKTWLQVFINGKKEKEGEFGANEVIKYEGGDTDQIFVKIGNIKNADIFFNGQQEDESIAYKNVWKKTF